MELMEVLRNYINLTILVICLVVGYVIKNHTKLNNLDIPTVVVVLGLVLAIVNAVSTKQPISLEVLACGLVSGFGSTGCHQLLKTWRKKLGG